MARPRSVRLFLRTVAPVSTEELAAVEVMGLRLLTAATEVMAAEAADHPDFQIPQSAVMAEPMAAEAADPAEKAVPVKTVLLPEEMETAAPTAEAVADMLAQVSRQRRPPEGVAAMARQRLALTSTSLAQAPMAPQASAVVEAVAMVETAVPEVPPPAKAHTQQAAVVAATAETAEARHLSTAAVVEVTAVMAVRETPSVAAVVAATAYQETAVTADNPEASRRAAVTMPQAVTVSASSHIRG